MYIKKDGTVLNVTRGAYLSLFKDKGWKATKEPKKGKKSKSEPKFMAPQPSEEVNAPEVEEVPFGALIKESETLPEEDFDDEEDYEVVLEEMTVKQLIRYAEENDIDLDGATRKESIIRTIKEVMGE